MIKLVITEIGTSKIPRDFARLLAIEIELRIKSRKLASRYYGWTDVPWTIPLDKNPMNLNDMWGALRSSSDHEYAKFKMEKIYFMTFFLYSSRTSSAQLFPNHSSCRLLQYLECDIDSFFLKQQNCPNKLFLDRQHCLIRLKRF